MLREANEAIVSGSLLRILYRFVKKLINYTRAGVAKLFKTRANSRLPGH